MLSNVALVSDGGNIPFTPGFNRVQHPLPMKQNVPVITQRGGSYRAQYVGTRTETPPTDTGNGGNDISGGGPDFFYGNGPGFVWRSPGVKTPGGPGPSTSTGTGSPRTIGGGANPEPTQTEPPGDVAGSGSGSGSPSDPTQSTDPVTAALLQMLLAEQGGAYGGAGLAPGVQGTGNVTNTQSSNPLVIIFLVIAVVGGFYLWHKYKGKLIKKEGA